MILHRVFTTKGEFTRLRTEYWGSAYDTPPNPATRKKRLERIAEDALIRGTATFHFMIGTRLVCEKAALLILGIIGNNGCPLRLKATQERRSQRKMHQIMNWRD